MWKPNTWGVTFVADRLSVLCLHEETLVPAPVGGAPSIDSGTHDNFNNAASALHSEQTLYSNPAVSNIHAVLYLLHSIFRQIPGGLPLSPSRPPYDRFTYGLASSTDTYARDSKGCWRLSPSHPNSWEWQAALLPLPTNPWMVRV